MLLWREIGPILRQVEMLQKRLGRRIQEIRTAKGFKSQEDLASYLKLHRTFIGLLETGRKDFRLSTLVRVSEGLGVTLSEMFDGVEGGKARKIKGGPKSDAVLRKELTALEDTVRRIREHLDKPKATDEKA